MARGFTDAETDSEGVPVGSRGDAVARDMGMLIEGLNAGNPAAVEGFVKMLRQAGPDSDMAGVFSMVLDRLDPAARATILEAAGGQATADALQQAEAQAVAADTAPPKESRMQQNPRFSWATYGGTKLADRMRSYGTADAARGQVSNVARDELGMIRAWQRGKLQAGGMSPDAVKQLTDQELVELVGMPSSAEFYAMADNAQRKMDMRIGGIDGDTDSGLVNGHIEANLGGASTAAARGRLLDTLLEQEAMGGRPVLNLPETMRGWRMRLPQGVVSDGKMGVELKYPNTQMSPEYYAGLFLDSIGRQATDQAIGPLVPLMQRSVEHYAPLPPETVGGGRGKQGASEAALAQEFAVPEVKGGIPLIRRMAELDSGVQPRGKYDKRQVAMNSLRPFGVSMFTDKPINRGTDSPFFLRDVLIDRGDAAATELPPADLPPPDAPMPADNETSMMDYRNLPPHLLQMLLA